METSKIVVLMCCIWASSALAADPITEGKLSGKYRITPKELFDPGLEDKPDRVGIYFDGEAAKAVYNAMLTPVQHLTCHDQPLPPTKIAGNLQCEANEEKNEYHCSVGVTLDTGETFEATQCY